MQRLLWVCLAGALGTGARYLVSQWAYRALGAAFPYGTLIVNVTGCFLIALLMQWALLPFSLPDELRGIVSTGFIGGLTTYSSFNYETTRLLRAGDGTSALCYVGLTLGLCFSAGSWGPGWRPAARRLEPPDRVIGGQAVFLEMSQLRFVEAVWLAPA